MVIITLKEAKAAFIKSVSVKPRKGKKMEYIFEATEPVEPKSFTSAGELKFEGAMIGARQYLTDFTGATILEIVCKDGSVISPDRIEKVALIGFNTLECKIASPNVAEKEEDSDGEIADE